MSDLRRDTPLFGGAWFMVVAMALTAMGLVVVASASASLHRPILDASFLKTTFGRQCVFVVVGFSLMWLTGRFIGPWLLADRRRFTFATAALITATAMCLVVVLVIGDVTRGSQRWLRFAVGGFEIGLQPSELAKPAMIAFLALFLTRPGCRVKSFGRTFLPVMLAIGAGGALIGTEDLGTAALACLVAGLMVWVGGCSYRHLGLLALLGAIGFFALIWFEPYRMQRLWAYQYMWDDPQGKGYQAVQSLATLASGGWYGRGLGAGVQKYGYLPESRTDFVFAVLCEEMGFVGGLIVIAMFALFVWLGFGACRTARTHMDYLLAFGLTAMIGFQALINLCVVTVWVPTTGIPLPFISAGGTSFLVLSVVVGMLMALGQRSEESESEPLPVPMPAGELA